MKNPKITAIVLAAGQGKRMKSSIQKQYMQLAGHPVLYYCLKAFEESSVGNVILVTGESETEYCRKQIVEKYGFSKVTGIVTGGKERYDSVYNGLCAADCDYVLIHDGARPLVNTDIIERTIDAVKKYDACTTGMPVKDTIKRSDEEGMVADTLPRKSLWQIQTPQAFRYSIIKDAHERLRNGENDFCEVTDDSMLVEQMSGCRVKLIEGDYKNIKVTTPEDIVLAGAFLK